MSRKVFDDIIINNFLENWKKSQPTEQTELYKYFITNYEIHCRTNYKINKIIYSDEKKIIDTTLYTNYKNNICARRDYDVTLLNDINNLLPQTNNKNFDYIIIKHKEKPNEIISILILNKNECKNVDKYNDIWSVSYICAKGAKSGTASVMLGLSIYALKLKQNIIFLQLAQGYANISGFCSYYRFGFKENSNLDCDYYDKIENIKNIKMELNLEKINNEHIFKVINDINYIHGGEKLDVCSKIENRLELQRNLQTEYENKVLEKYRWKNDDYMNQILTTGKYKITDEEQEYINFIENKKIPPPLSLTAPPPLPEPLTQPLLQELPPPPVGTKRKSEYEDKNQKKIKPYKTKYSVTYTKVGDNYICYFCDNMPIIGKQMSKHITSKTHIQNVYKYDFLIKDDNYECNFCDKIIAINQMDNHVLTTEHTNNVTDVRVYCEICEKWKLLSKKRQENGDQDKDSFTCDTCLLQKTDKGKSIKGKSIKGKSIKGKSIKRKSIKRKSIKRKSIKRKSIKRKSIKRKSIRKKRKN